MSVRLERFPCIGIQQISSVGKCFILHEWCVPSSSQRVAVAEMSEEEICNLLEEKGLKSSKSEDNETDAGMNEEL